MSDSDVQERMEGTYDEPVEAVQEKARQYTATLRERMASQQLENDLRAELIEVMTEHDVLTVELDGDTVTLEHTEKDRIKVKAKQEIDE